MQNITFKRGESVWHFSFKQFDCLNFCYHAVIRSSLKSKDNLSLCLSVYLKSHILGKDGQGYS